MAANASQRHRIGAGKRHLTHPANVLEGEVARREAQDTNGVDPDLPEDEPVCVDPKHGQLPQPPGLLARNRLDRRPEPQPRASLDLTDDQRPAVKGDDVDLTVLAAPVPIEYQQPGL